MFIVKHRKIFYSISVVLIGASIFAMAFWGLNLGIDFKGGSILEISYKENKPELNSIKNLLEPLNLDSSVREAGTDGFLIRMKEISPEQKSLVENEIKKAGGQYELKRFNSIGPVLGKEAGRKSITSIVLVLLAIVLFVTFAFRKVSEPVSSFKYGLITIVALFHDVLVPTGVFAYLGYFAGVQVDTLFVTALLVVLGFSVHDTIVVFDRVRENLKNQKDNKTNKPFDEIVGQSIKETFSRSINTSLTTMFSLVVLYILGGEATRYFSLALLIGIITGTYSSVFIASPLLVTVQKWQEKRALKVIK
jgi:preprotein translocase subunit SecF